MREIKEVILRNRFLIIMLTSIALILYFSSIHSTTVYAATSGLLCFNSADSDLDGTHNSITRNIGGLDFKISAVTGSALTFDSIGGIYGQDGASSTITIEAPSGYIFDVANFEAYSGGELTIFKKYANNSVYSTSYSFYYKSTPPVLKSKGETIRYMKEITFQSRNAKSVLQNILITNIRLIPVNKPEILNDTILHLSNTSAEISYTVDSKGDDTQTDLDLPLIGAGSNPFFYSSNIVKAEDGSKTFVILCSLAANTTYYYQIAARNGAGTAYGPVKSFTTPGFVSDFANTSITGSTATFTWSAPKNATQVIIQKRQSGATVWTTADTGMIDVNATGATVSGLNPTTNYSFRLFVAGGDNPGASNVISVTTGSSPIADFTLSSKTTTTAAFTWTAAVSGSALRVEKSTDGNTWTAADTGAIATSAAGATVSGLSSGTTYTFRLLVTGGCNEGSSNTIVLTTDYLYVSLPTSPATTNTVRTAVAGDISGLNTSVAVAILRTSENGKIIDTLVLSKDKILEALKAFTTGSTKDFVIDISDLPEDKADEMSAKISQDAVEALSGANVPLRIKTNYIQIILPAKSIKELSDGNEDFTWKIIPIREDSEKAELEKSILSAPIVKKYSGGGAITLIGTPVIIEANYKNITTNVFFTFEGIEIPSDGVLREKYLKSLAIYIKQSDGEELIETGDIKYDEKGNPIGIEIEIDKFSTFAIIQFENQTKTDNGATENNTANTAPLAVKAVIKGKAQVGKVLTVAYQYMDAEGDKKAKTIIRWYRADSKSGKNKTLIEGANKSTYKLTKKDIGKYIFCDISPVAKTGTLNGKTVTATYKYIIKEKK